MDGVFIRPGRTVLWRSALNTMSKATIAVFGATGSQGGSVAHHLAARGAFRVRALTRCPDAYDGPADEAVFADHTYMGPDADARKTLARQVATAPFTPLDAWLSTHAPRATT